MFLAQLSVDINALAGWVIVAILGISLTGAIALVRVMSRKLDALHEAHLGAQARDRNGDYKWYAKADDGLINHIIEESRANRTVIEKNTEVMRELVEEIRIDRKVNERLLRQQGANDGG